MSWETVFHGANGWALFMWVVLIFLPRKPVTMATVFYAGVGLICLAYAILLALMLGGVIGNGGQVEGGASFTSVAGVRAIFASDAGVTIGWIHYLALDLFAGIWVARDAEAKGFSRLVQAPVLLLTFVAGPVGLLVWFAIREKRARAVGRRKIN